MFWKSGRESLYLLVKLFMISIVLEVPMRLTFFTGLQNNWKIVKISEDSLLKMLSN